MFNPSHLYRRFALNNRALIGKKSKIEKQASFSNLARKRDKIVIGDFSVIRGELLVFPNGGSITIGSWCYVGEGTRIWSMESVEIGDNVLISHNVNIMDSNGHPLDHEERRDHFRMITTKGHPSSDSLKSKIKSRKIIIEDDVWINFNVTILKGVKIGARSIIGAGCLIASDIPEDTIIYPEKSNIREVKRT